MFEALLLNFLFLLFPVIIYLLFFEMLPGGYHRGLLLGLTAVTMILCMLKPIQLDNGFIFDLRYVPFLIVALYGSYKYVIPIYVLLNLIRLYVGGEGMLPSFLFSTAVLALVPLYSRRFLRFSSRGRVTAAVVITLLTMSGYLLSLCLITRQVNQEFCVLAVNALTVYSGVMGVIMILIERILTNIRSRDRMIQTERLTVVSELAASVSHEIRNPLTVTGGFLQLLISSPNITERERGFVRLSLQELQRAEKIVSDFLSFAKPQLDNMVNADMREDLEYTTNVIMPYASIHKVEVDFHFSNTLLLRYDRNQIQQSLINLYKNAIEAMKVKGGGTLTIDAYEQKQNLVLSIRDNGVGMTRDEISRLGRPYYSTKEEGTGLGMLMVYSTVSKLKGSIEVRSEKGEGTTFLLIFPAESPVTA